MSSIIIDITREDSSSVDAELLLGLRGQTGLSAYEYAVMQGYSGTENDFSILMASYATVAEAAAESASESAQSAVESAQSADASEGYASDAETSMNSAFDYASAARASATSASQSAGVASGKADEAGESATSASNSADAAASSASSASTSASSASTSASNASASATAAAGSAASASADADRAEDAKEFLENASATATALPEGSSPSVTLSGGVFNFAIPKGDTGRDGTDGRDGVDGVTPNISIGNVTTLEPSEDAYVTRRGTDANPIFDFGIPKGDDGTVPDLDLILPTDTASGDIVSITDGQSVVPVKSLKVTLEPIQDLHGYDKPWSGGAGVNMIDADNPLTFTTTIAIVFATPIPSGTMVYAYSSSHTYATEPSSGSKVIAMRFEDANNQVVGITYANSTGIDRVTLTGDAVRVLLYSNGYNYTDSAGVTVTVKDLMLSKSPITAYSPYSNICPISGHTDVVTEVSGVNVWDEEWELGSYGSDGLPVASTDKIRTKNRISVKPSKAYYFKNGGSGNLIIFWYDESDTVISYEGTNNAVKTSPSNAKYLRFRTNNYGTSYGNNISINYPSSDHDYHAYQGTTYTTTLGRTVYGGTLDVVSGELVVDRAMVTYNGSEAWDVNTSTKPWLLATSAPNDLKQGNATTLYVKKSNMFNPTSEIWGISGYGMLNNFTSFLVGYPDANGDANAFKSLLSSNPLQVVYELATPQTIQLTPQQVMLLHGNNNVWSDGSVEVTYNADVGLYIDKKLGTSGTRTLSMTRTLDTKSETDDTKSDNIQLAEDIIEKGDKVDDISKEDAL